MGLYTKLPDELEDVDVIILGGMRISPRACPAYLMILQVTYYYHS